MDLDIDNKPKDAVFWPEGTRELRMVATCKPRLLEEGAPKIAQSRQIVSGRTATGGPSWDDIKRDVEEHTLIDLTLHIWREGLWFTKPPKITWRYVVDGQWRPL